MRDGHAVARSSDFIIYSVEAASIDKVVAEYGPCTFGIFFFPSLFFSHYHSTSATKMYAVVAGQTSVKAPEKAAFEKYLPEDVHIVSCHSLHGPTVSPLGQPLVCFYSDVMKLKFTITRQSFDIVHRMKHNYWLKPFCVHLDLDLSTSPLMSTTLSPQIHKLSPMLLSLGTN